MFLPAKRAIIASEASDFPVDRASDGVALLAEIGLRVLKRDLGHLLLQLEQLQAEQIDAAKQPHLQPQLTDQERDAALELLRDPQLLQRIVSDLDQCGTVGEETNKLVGYVDETSRAS